MPKIAVLKKATKTHKNLNLKFVIDCSDPVRDKVLVRINQYTNNNHIIIYFHIIPYLLFLLLIVVYFRYILYFFDLRPSN